MASCHLAKPGWPGLLAPALPGLSPHSHLLLVSTAPCSCSRSCLCTSNFCLQSFFSPLKTLLSTPGRVHASRAPASAPSSGLPECIAPVPGALLPGSAQLSSFLIVSSSRSTAVSVFILPAQSPVPGTQLKPHQHSLCPLQPAVPSQADTCAHTAALDLLSPLCPTLSPRPSVAMGERLTPAHPQAALPSHQKPSCVKTGGGNAQDLPLSDSPFCFQLCLLSLLQQRKGEWECPTIPGLPVSA